jgi:hypothetical protein
VEAIGDLTDGKGVCVAVNGIGGALKVANAAPASGHSSLVWLLKAARGFLETPTCS